MSVFSRVLVRPRAGDGCHCERVMLLCVREILLSTAYGVFFGASPSPLLGSFVFYIVTNVSWSLAIH